MAIFSLVIMPTIESDDTGNIYVMFRNNLAGSRDMYLTQSSDKGLTFDNPRKLGLETWPLNGCPMDGGGLMAANSGEVATTWQREGKVYFSTPEEAEVMIGVGRAPAIDAGSKGIYIAWTSGEKVMIKVPDNDIPIEMGTGTSPKVLSVDNGEAILVVWIDQGVIKLKKMS